MRIGKTEFGDHIKSWTVTEFRRVFTVNGAVVMDIANNGYTIDSAWEFLTGKKISKDVPKVPAKGTKDKD